MLAKLREIVIFTYQPNYLSLVKQLKGKPMASVRCLEIARYVQTDIVFTF